MSDADGCAEGAAVLFAVVGGGACILCSPIEVKNSFCVRRQNMVEKWTRTSKCVGKKNLSSGEKKPLLRRTTNQDVNPQYTLQSHSVSALSVAVPSVPFSSSRVVAACGIVQPWLPAPGRPGLCDQPRMRVVQDAPPRKAPPATPEQTQPLRQLGRAPPALHAPAAVVLRRQGWLLSAPSVSSSTHRGRPRHR